MPVRFTRHEMNANRIARAPNLQSRHSFGSIERPQQIQVFAKRK
jgi:hypothetical protein